MHRSAISFLSLEVLKRPKKLSLLLAPQHLGLSFSKTQKNVTKAIQLPEVLTLLLRVGTL
jgi:hypothetical protein